MQANVPAGSIARTGEEVSYPDKSDDRCTRNQGLKPDIAGKRRRSTTVIGSWPFADDHAVVSDPIDEGDEPADDLDGWEAALARLPDRQERTIRALCDLWQHHLGDFARARGPIPDASVDRGDGVATDGGQDIPGVFSRLAELVDADGDVPDDGSGYDGVWTRTIEAAERERDWNVALNADLTEELEAADFPRGGDSTSVPGAQAVIFLGAWPAGVVGPGGGEILVEQLEDGPRSLEDEFLRDVETELLEAGADIERTVPGQDLVTDGGTEEWSPSCWDCERELPRRFLNTYPVHIDNEDGLGYEVVDVPLCDGCRKDRMHTHECQRCGEEYLHLDRAVECCPGNHEVGPIPDGGLAVSVCDVCREAPANGILPDGRDACRSCAHDLDELERAVADGGSVGYECVLCGRTWTDRGQALQCCSGSSDDDGPDFAAETSAPSQPVATDGGRESRRFVLDEHRHVSYGPVRNSDKWALTFTDDEVGRVDLLLDEEAMYELWIEVGDTPFPRDGTEAGDLRREVVHETSGMDAEMLRKVLERVEEVNRGDV